MDVRTCVSSHWDVCSEVTDYHVVLFDALLRRDDFYEYDDDDDVL